MELIWVALGGAFFIAILGLGEMCLLRSIYRCPQCGEEDGEGMRLAVGYSMSCVNMETAIPVYYTPVPKMEQRKCKKCGGVL